MSKDKDIGRQLAVTAGAIIIAVLLVLAVFSNPEPTVKSKPKVKAKVETVAKAKVKKESNEDKEIITKKMNLGKLEKIEVGPYLKTTMFYFPTGHIKVNKKVDSVMYWNYHLAVTSKATYMCNGKVDETKTPMNSIVHNADDVNINNRCWTVIE